MGSDPVKLCFVTVGATASFERLIQEVLNEAFFRTLASNNFTHLTIQYGKDTKALVDELLGRDPDDSPDRHGIILHTFDFAPDLSHYMGMTMERPPQGMEHLPVIQKQKLGLIVTHAGTGSILEALRCGVPTIVVPNPDLADNHQEELALMIQKLQYGVMAHVGDVIQGVKDINKLIVDKLDSRRRDLDEAQVRPALSDQLSFVD
ncbi:family 28 glycosyltransferase [Penicillium angulare]|uniref:family 28 glycosyltransferase n=1 Tax=Penicillium angulare TaxID=116970 RepID=UPI00254177BE|nr:family 28 glycosyltransferase [Penicillium angulare]KAJ5281101.1 family 28 glycosyltransferase [Penicillium angulare]